MIEKDVNEGRLLNTRSILSGDAKYLDNLESLRKNFEAVGRPEIDMAYVGGLSVLLIFLSESSAMDFLVKDSGTW